MLAVVASLALGCTGEVIADAGTSVGGTQESSSGLTTSTGTESGPTDTSTSTDTSTDTGTGTETDTSTDTDTGTDTSTETETGTDTDGAGPNIDLGVLALLDVNPTSATFDQTRHPDDYPGQISAWYFGHAT